LFSIFLRAIYLSLKIIFYFCKFQVKCQAFKNKNYVKKQHLKFASFTNNNNNNSIPIFIFILYTLNRVNREFLFFFEIKSINFLLSQKNKV
jgi:hypothetical protein